MNRSPGLSRHFLALIVCLCGAAPTFADAKERFAPVWQINNARNTIYLVGSVHLLRESDYPLPQPIYAAYEDADVLIMELDMDDMDPMETQSLLNELGMITDGRELQDIMGPKLYAQAERDAAKINIPLAMLANAEPWFAAITVDNLIIMRLGFDPAYGVETHLTKRARSDGKDVLGFETQREQMEFLDNLSLGAQRNLLLQTLADGADAEETLDGLIEAWRTGDVDYMERNLLSELRQYEELFRVLVADRNRAWSRRIDSLTDDSRNYLIVVGAMHLVGDKGVPALLEALGHEVRQLRD